jgi:hypothetical protein
MKFCFAQIERIKSGGWKVYAIGQPAAHIMDWRGCNFRVMTAPFQPQRGFASAELAKAWALSHLTSDGLRRYCAERGDGASHQDPLDSVSIMLPNFVGPRAFTTGRRELDFILYS